MSATFCNKLQLPSRCYAWRTRIYNFYAQKYSYFSILAYDMFTIKYC